MRPQKNSSDARRGWGPFTSRQLTTIVCVAVVSVVVAVPTVALAASGAFTSTTVTPAVTATNSATVASAVGVKGIASATNTNARYGVVGSASGANGIGVQGGGTKFGVFSNGPLGVAAGKSLSCGGCVTAGDLSTSAKGAAKGALIYQSSQSFTGPYSDGEAIASFAGIPAGLLCVSGTASASTTSPTGANMSLHFVDGGGYTYLQFALNPTAATSHQELVELGTVCADNFGGPLTWYGGGNSDTISDSSDVGSLSVQVFSE